MKPLTIRDLCATIPATKEVCILDVDMSGHAGHDLGDRNKDTNPEGLQVKSSSWRLDTRVFVRSRLRTLDGHDIWGFKLLQNWIAFRHAN